MFFYLISKVFVTNGNKLKIFVMGIIFYILAHAYLFSKYSDSNVLIVKYRNYLYYLFGVDCAITFLFASKKTNSIKDEEEDDYEDEPDNRSDKKKQIDNKNNKDDYNDNDNNENENENVGEDPRYNQIDINNINSSKTREEIIRMMTELRKSQGDQQKNTEHCNDLEEEEEQYEKNNSDIKNEINNTQSERSKSEDLNNASITVYKSKKSKDTISSASIPVYLSKK